MTQHHRIPQFLLVLLLLTACGGGGLDLAEGGLEGTGLGEGAITDFGSIIVNDIRYDIDQAGIYLNNANAGAEQLKRGMYVSVETAHNETAARRITYRDTLRGPVDFVSPSMLRMLGHIVQITPDTRLYGFAELSELQPGDTVRVSGPASGPEVLPATLVERVPAGDARITGAVFNLDEAGQSFFIAGIRIFYDQVQTLPAQLYNGLPVEVTGSKENNLLIARHIQALTPGALPAGSNAVITGTVTRFDSPEDFAVQYRPVRLPRALAADLADPLRIGGQVTIRGITDGQGVIEISEIILNEENPAITNTPNDQIFRVSGPVSGIDAQILEVFGVGVRFDELTRFLDMSGQIPDDRVESMREGDYVSIGGAPDQQGEFLASMVNYDPSVPPELRQLQGPATDINALNRGLHILGVPVFTGAQTRYYDASDVEFNLPPPGAPLQPPSGTETDAGAFFARLNGEFLVYAFGQAAETGTVAEMLVVLSF